MYIRTKKLQCQPLSYYKDNNFLVWWEINKKAKILIVSLGLNTAVGRSIIKAGEGYFCIFVFSYFETVAKPARCFSNAIANFE